MKAVYTEKANEARSNGMPLVNAHDKASEKELKALAVACIWEGSPKSAAFFSLNKMLYHLVARCCEAAQQRKSTLKVVTKEEGNLVYSCLCFHVDRHKTSSSQDLQVYSHKSSYLMCVYFALAYQLVIGQGENDYLFPEYASKLGSNHSNKIDSKTSTLFNEYYKILAQFSTQYDQHLIEDAEFDLSELELPKSRTSHSLGKKGAFKILLFVYEFLCFHVLTYTISKIYVLIYIYLGGVNALADNGSL